MAARKAITKAQLARWPKATRAEKGEILDAVCAVTGWHRDHARKAIRTMLANPDPGPRRRRNPVQRYDAAAVDLLTQCWAVLDGPCGKRLHPALADTLANLARHGHLNGIDPAVIDQVRAMSPATIDRRLAPARTGLISAKGLRHTRPGSLLKTSIPLKTWAQWNDTIPGFVQIDLVGHEGGDNNGHFHYSLDATDIATGWTETITVRSKGERIVADGLEQLQLRFPFHLAGIHSDIHTHWRRRPGVTARFRPEHRVGDSLPVESGGIRIPHLEGARPVDRRPPGQTDQTRPRSVRHQTHRLTLAGKTDVRHRSVSRAN